MTFNMIDLLHSLRSRLRLIVGIAATIFVLVAVAAFIQPRQYLATSSLLIDLLQTDQTDDKGQQSTAVIDSIIGTQVSVLKSDLVLTDVALRSGLVSNPKDLAEVGEVSAKIAKNLNVHTDRQSNVISIEYLDKDADRAAKIANLFSEVFLAKQVQLRAAPARGNAVWYDARTAEVRHRYEVAQQRLTAFQRQQGIIGVDRMDLEGERLKSLSTELVTAQAEAAAARAKTGSSAMPEVSSALSVQGIEQQVATQAAHVAELAKTLGPNHPEMRAARAQLATLSSQLGAARSTQTSSLSAASSAAARREATLRSQLAEQQARMIRMSGVQDQLMVLQRDVDAARATYDTVRQRFNEAALQSEISRANASVLDRATAPLLPAKPNIILWLLGGIFLGVFTGIAVALAMELLGPRVRSATGLASAADIEVLADLTPTTWRAGQLGTQG